MSARRRGSAVGYRLCGRIEALLGPGCREIPTGAVVRFFTPRLGAATAFAVLSPAQAKARESRWLADAELADDGSFTVDLPVDGRSYEGGALEVGLRITGPKQGRGKPRTVECTLLASTPAWQPGSGAAQVWDWHYALPAPAWAQVRHKLGAYVIVGRLSARDGIAPLAGVRVAAFDADLVQDDPLGHGTTDPEGWFRIDYRPEAMRRTPIPGLSREDGSADVYFTADHNGQHLLDEPRSAGRNRDRRNVGSAFCVRLRSTAAPLTLTIDTPAAGKITNQPQLTITGRASEPCQLTLDDEPVDLDVDQRFTHQVTLTEGSNTLPLTGTATATGAQARYVLKVVLDTSAPAPPDLILITADLDDTGHANVTGLAGAVEPAAVVQATNTGSGDQSQAEADAEGAFALALPAAAGDTVTLTAQDSAGNTSTPAQLTLAGALPPDPADVAPPLPTTTITPLSEATAFLYTGPNPIQTGADPAAFTPHRAAVLRGRVTTPTGNPLPGATVTVHGHPEYGQTLTRADGWFDLAANGGSQLTISYVKDSYLTAHRTTQTSWHKYSLLPDVTLLPADPAVTHVEFTDAAPARMIHATTVTDHDGSRRASLFIPAATTADMQLPDGTSQPLTTAHVRITEYTVGDQGAAAMPADLPPSSAYTYAAECSADEAIQAGASTVRFNQPVILYLENFLDFPPGLSVPLGSYDRTTSHWTAEPDGRVITLISITAGKANLDITGDGQADTPSDLADFGISDDERTHLAATYPPGQQLWRSPLRHFTPWDCNWPYWCPDGSTYPEMRVAEAAPHTPEPRKCPGSIIDMDNQILGERLALAGTGLSLHYSSDRTPGFTAARTLHIPLTDENPPAPLKRIDLDVEIEGRRFHSSHPPTAKLIHTFTWDGLDAAERHVQGARPATVTIGYVYPAVYVGPARFAASFAMTAGSGSRSGGGTGGSIGGIGGSGPLGNRTRNEITLRQSYTTTIGSWNTPAQAGLGGWSLGNHHTYDATSHTLYLGNGTQRSATALGSVITTVAGTGQLGFGGDGGPATQAQIGAVRGLTIAPDGSLYFCDTDNNRVRRIDLAGTVTTVAGAAGHPPQLGDGGPATAARVAFPFGVAVAPDGSFYILEQRRLRKVDTKGIISTVAVFDTAQYMWGITLGPDGSIYVSEPGQRIYRIAPDGQESILAGGGATFQDNVRATETTLDPHGLVCAPDGTLYVASQRQGRIRKITPDGIITTIAGPGWAGHLGDGGPATDAFIAGPYSLALATDGTLYLTDATRIRAITADGIINTMAGTGQNGDDGDGGPAVNAQLNGPYSLATNPNGALYIGFAHTYRIRTIDSPFPGITTGEFAIPSADGQQLHVFDTHQRHVRTLNTYTSATLIAFTYHDHDRLTTITHGDAAEDNAVTITRDANGQPTAITGPDGHRTQLTLNSGGYLAQITDPADATTTLSYHPGGLLATLTNPLGHQHTYTFEPDGRLHSDTNPLGTTTLAAKRTATGHTITALTTEGRESTYAEERLPTGEKRRTMRCCGEHETVTTTAPDGSRTTAVPEGTTNTERVGSDPIWGMQTPFVTGSSITTPAGLRRFSTTERQASLSVSVNPLSLIYLAEHTAINGRVYTEKYEAATSTWTVITPSGSTATATTDTTGRLLTAQKESLAPIAARYDARGRLAALTWGTGPSARTWEYNYSIQGNLHKITDPLGQVTGLSHDALGHPIAITMPDDSILRIGYDAAGNAVSVTPPGRSNHIFRYDQVGNLIAYQPPPISTGSDPTSYTYDSDGLLTGIARPGNRSTSLMYDEAGRLERITSAGHSINYTYLDGSRRLATATTQSGVTVLYEYDGPLLESETWQGPVSGSVSHVYNADLLPDSQRVNTEPRISVTRDDDGYLEKFDDLTIVRDPVSGLRISATLANITEFWRHNQFAEPVEHRVTCNGTEIYAVTCAWDALGRIEERRETSSGASINTIYTYDACGRLVSVTIDGAKTSYHYDNNGNRIKTVSPSGTSVTAIYNDQDQLLAHGEQRFTYGAEGELEQVIDPDLGAIHYKYDSFGRLTKIETFDGNEIEYIVDAAGRRISRMINGEQSSIFLYDGLRLVAEVDVKYDTTTRFIHSGSSAAPTYLIKKGKTYRIITDHLGSPLLVIDVDSGDVAQEIRYDPWGKIVHDTQPGFQPLGFAAGLYDPATRLTRFGARDYDAVTGRWSSKDQLGFAGGDTNAYSYALNNPVNIIDPSGLAWTDWEDWDLESIGNFSNGFADTITFGLVGAINRASGVSQFIDKCSDAYSGGEWAGILWGLIVGAGGGWRGAGVKAKGMEFSHWIPNRILSPLGSRWLKTAFGRSRFNGNYVSPFRHYLHDSFRYPSGWRNFPERFPVLLQQFDRIPRVLYGAGAGVGLAGGSAASR